MATKNKHRRENTSNAVNRQHKRRLYIDNRTRTYAAILVVNICISTAFTGRFLGLLGVFPPDGNMIPWLQHLLINISNCFATIGSWFTSCETQGQSPARSGEQVCPLRFVPC